MAEEEVEMEYEELLNDSSDGSSRSSNGGQDGDQPNLAKKENTDVSRWRYAVVTMLFITSAVVLAFTYNFMSRAEEEEFNASVRLPVNT